MTSNRSTSKKPNPDAGQNRDEDKPSFDSRELGSQPFTIKNVNSIGVANPSGQSINFTKGMNSKEIKINLFI